jgi:hypothetical protein
VAATFVVPFAEIIRPLKPLQSILARSPSGKLQKVPFPLAFHRDACDRRVTVDLPNLLIESIVDAPDVSHQS